MRAGQLNAGAWQHSWLFLCPVSTDITSWAVPGALPWEVAPGISARLAPGFHSPPSTFMACLEDTFLPFCSPAEGVGGEEGREERGIPASQGAAGMLCPRGAPVWAAAEQGSSQHSSCTSTVPPVLPLPTKPGPFLCPRANLPSLWLHTASPGCSKGGSELLQDRSITKQLAEPYRGTFPLYQMPVSIPLEMTKSMFVHHSP